MQILGVEKAGKIKIEAQKMNVVKSAAQSLVWLRDVLPGGFAGRTVEELETY